MKAPHVKGSADNQPHQATSATWQPRRLAGRHRRTRFVVAAVVGVAAVTLAGTLLLRGASDDSAAFPPGPIPGAYLPTITSAAGSCPTLTAARLAGQIMANTGFDPSMHTADGRSGIAGLNDETWRRWTPSPTAGRADPDANIIALAHQMCDLVGQLHIAHPPGELWQLALAAHKVSLDSVLSANSIPAESAAYVGRVVRYADWYSDRAALTPSPTADSASPALSPDTPSGSSAPPASAATTTAPATTPQPVATTSAATPAYTTKTILATFVIRPGQKVGTERTEIRMQLDGDLVIADVSSGRILWRAGIANRGAAQAVFQADGHFVVYTAGNSEVLWTAYTMGNDGAVLVIRADGNVVVATGGRILWQSHTAR